MRVAEFEGDAAVAVLFEHAFKIVHVRPFHATCKVQKSLQLGGFGEGCDMKSGSRSQEAFVDRHQSHLRQPDLTQCEVPRDLFRDVRDHRMLLVFCSPQTKVELNAQKQLMPEKLFHVHILGVVIVC